MNKILIIILILLNILNASLVEDGINAYNEGHISKAKELFKKVVKWVE